MELKPGYKQTEERAANGWTLYSLNDVCERISVGLATSVTQFYTSAGVPIVRNLNIKDGYFDDRDMLYVDAAFAKANAGKAARGLDVLTVRTGANLSDTCVLPTEFDGCQTFTTLITTPDPRILDPYYLCYHMNSLAGKREMERLEVGGGKNNLNTGHLKQYRISIPSLHEQRATVVALRDTDASLSSLDRLIAKKRNLKQAAMQQLLTGQTRLPGFGDARSRFKETEAGNIPEDWEARPLLSTVALPTGQVDPRREPFRSMILAAPDHVESRTGRLLERRTAADQGAISGKYLFEPGDVVYSKIRPYLRKTFCADFGGLCSADMYPLRPKNGTSPGFVHSLLLSHRFSTFAESVSVRSGMPKINRNELSEYVVAMPSPLEQQAIAAVLSDMDAEIVALENRRDKTRLLKQGMMQELLTGRTRLV